MKTHHQCLFIATSIALLLPYSSSSEENPPTCPEGYLLGFNNQCIKKFVPPERKECPMPDLRFGNFDLQIGGRVVDFWCEEGWTLAPEDFASAVCILGVWSKPQPQCVRPGCSELKPPANGRLNHELDGALARFSCNNELQISGESVLGCDGEFWNATVPSCVKPLIDGQTSGQGRLICPSLLLSVLLCAFPK